MLFSIANVACMAGTERARKRGQAIRERKAREEGRGGACYQDIASAVFYFRQAISSAEAPVSKHQQKNGSAGKDFPSVERVRQATAKLLIGQN